MNKDQIRKVLDALLYHVEQTRPIDRTTEAIAILQSALDEPEGDAFVWCIESTNSADWCFSKTKRGVISNATLMDRDCHKTEPFPLYLHPAPKQTPLTDAQLTELYRRDERSWAYGRAIEKAHGIGSAK